MPDLIRDSRKTECGAKQFLAGLVVRAAPFALLRETTEPRSAESDITQLLQTIGDFPGTLELK